MIGYMSTRIVTVRAYLEGGGTLPLKWQAQDADLPVVGVTWYEAMAWAKAKGCRLPASEELDDLPQVCPLYYWTSSTTHHDDTLRVMVRGGSFLSSAFDLRAVRRFRHDPNYRLDHLGFRVVSK